MPLRFEHLSVDDHEVLAETLIDLQDDLAFLSRVVHRAPFTDEVLRIQKQVQERLIDPLRKASGSLQYPSVGYHVGKA